MDSIASQQSLPTQLEDLLYKMINSVVDNLRKEMMETLWEEMMETLKKEMMETHAILLSSLLPMETKTIASWSSDTEPIWRY